MSTAPDFWAERWHGSMKDFWNPYQITWYIYVTYVTHTIPVWCCFTKQMSPNTSNTWFLQVISRGWMANHCNIHTLKMQHLSGSSQTETIHYTINKQLHHRGHYKVCALFSIQSDLLSRWSGPLLEAFRGTNCCQCHCCASVGGDTVGGDVCSGLCIRGSLWKSGVVLGSLCDWLGREESL